VGVSDDRGPPCASSSLKARGGLAGLFFVGAGGLPFSLEKTPLARLLRGNRGVTLLKGVLPSLGGGGLVDSFMGEPGGGRKDPG